MMSMTGERPEVIQGWRGPHLSVFFPRKVAVNPFILSERPKWKQ